MNGLLLRAFEYLGFETNVTRQVRPAYSANANVNAPLDQIRQVMQAEFSARKVMNKAEYAVFKIVEEEAQAIGGRHRVFAQTSLGELIYTPDQAAFRLINSKRVDVVVISPFGDPLLAIEYQGEGHYQGNAVVRDAVKKEALRKAGICFLEINVNESSEVTRLRVREALTR